jgi:hypothetical protein
MEQPANLLVPALACLFLRGRIELCIPYGQIGAVSHKRRDLSLLLVPLIAIYQYR